MSLFDHISIRTDDIDTVRRFYQATLASLGVQQKFFAERPKGGVAGFGRDRVELFIEAAPLQKRDPIHLAFSARSQHEVNIFHAAALAAGGQDNGKPGLRPNYHEHYYAAFIIDPCGNNVEAVFQDANPDV
ncbi:VOC family protein [Salinicola halimionae]|uniref:VOC family protein n=1 Tax=Salinicola halimionae TaxID=1949081 RepID=UPI000DA1674E|nr:VOC family protein [Salinicola halimionae]